VAHAGLTRFEVKVSLPRPDPAGAQGSYNGLEVLISPPETIIVDHSAASTQRD
jgi:hypothetical protein